MSANPYAPPRAAVRDVVAPTADLLTAEPSTRLGAAIVDGLIFAAMVYLPMFAGLALNASAADSGNEAGSTIGMIVLGLTVIGFGIWLWMTLKQMSATGQSLAKKYFGIKVVRSDGSPASLGNLIFKRNVLNWMLSIIPLYGFIDPLFIFSAKRQCLHDKLADTIVVVA